jgi:hypothetical protein
MSLEKNARFRIIEDMLLRWIFSPAVEEVSGDRLLHVEVLHNL